MTEERELGEAVRAGTPTWLIMAIVLLGALSGISFGLAWSASNQARQAQEVLGTEIRTVKEGFAKDSGALQQRLAKTEEVNTGLQGELSLVTKRLRITQGELKKARQEAAQAREENAKQIAAMDSSIKGELATKASAEEVKAVSSEVTVVRGDLDTTRKDFQMARSELGTLIARNHDEIDQLRRLGEREYIEFSVQGKGKPQKVGNITVELRGTNPKNHQFTLALVVADLRVEKRNRTINEPIFFYTQGARQPLELVINQVSKNKVLGYLSIPKINQTTSGN